MSVISMTEKTDEKIEAEKTMTEVIDTEEIGIRMTIDVEETETRTGNEKRSVATETETVIIRGNEREVRWQVIDVPRITNRRLPLAEPLPTMNGAS